MQGRTVILVSHHVQLCVSGASYVVALENGQVQFSGKPDSFLDSGVMSGLVQSVNTDATDENDEASTDHTVRTKTSHSTGLSSETSSTVVSEVKQERKSPRKLVEEEQRAVGRIKRDIWETYIRACGDARYWVPFVLIMVLATLSPVAENGWLK
jgi:ABC-type glutathione transport system ATPase component